MLIEEKCCCWTYAEWRLDMFWTRLHIGSGAEPLSRTSQLPTQDLSSSEQQQAEQQSTHHGSLISFVRARILNGNELKLMFRCGLVLHPDHWVGQACVGSSLQVRSRLGVNFQV